ncbi:MAG: hypothetical protein KDG50_08230 [Chromatiales bacterium]|nr:hypothetical protein [Chromatiales bacterium]
MNLLWLAVGLCAFGAALLLVSGARRLRSGRAFSATWRVGNATVLGVLAAVLGLAGLDLHTYHRLTHERPVATLELVQVSPQRFVARLDRADDERPIEMFNLAGDEWQLDARVLKWRGPAILAGFDTLYRLDRIAGRFRDISRERSGPREVHDLNASETLDLWSLVREHPRWLGWLDAQYGSATYLPMVDMARYKVSISTSGLIARADNDVAERAVQNWK